VAGKQRGHAQVAVRAELTGKPHVGRRAHAAQHLHLLGRGRRNLLLRPSILMRQVEQRPRPPHTEACGMPAIRLASNTDTPRTIWTTRPLG
jgi:hypothetical protein